MTALYALSMSPSCLRWRQCRGARVQVLLCVRTLQVFLLLESGIRFHTTRVRPTPLRTQRPCIISCAKRQANSKTMCAALRTKAGGQNS